MNHLPNLKKLINVLENEVETGAGFDVYRMLGIEYYELRHTTTLAWLLDPKQTHGFNDKFLAEFLSVLREQYGEEHRQEIGLKLRDKEAVHVLAEVPLAKADADGKYRFGYKPGKKRDSLSDVSIVDESAGTKRLDVLMDLSGFAIAIEAKIKAKQGNGQLKNYREALCNYVVPSGGNKIPICLYLPLDEDDEPEEGWRRISWKENVGIPLRRVLDDATIEVDRKVKEVLTDYAALIDRLTGDGEQDKLTMQIKKIAQDSFYVDLISNARDEFIKLHEKQQFDPLVHRHRRTLSLLWKHVLGPRGELAKQMVEDLEAAAGGIEVLGRVTADGFVNFLPKPWDRNQALSKRHGGVSKLFCYHLEVKDQIRDGRKVEVKIWFPPGGETDSKRKIWERVKGRKYFELERITKFKEGKPKFKYSAKVFSKTFAYEDKDGEYVLADEAKWKLYLENFGTVVEKQWEALCNALAA